jgi:hypothetical protein
MSARATKPLSARAAKKRDTETLAMLEAIAAPIRESCLSREYQAEDRPVLEERVFNLEHQLKGLEEDCLRMWDNGCEGYGNVYNLKGRIEPFKNCFSFRTKELSLLRLAMEECKLLMEIAFITLYLNGV